MSRSSPPPSSTARNPLDQADPSAAVPRRAPLARVLNLRLARIVRWLHIYVSMLGLGVVLFFSVTGITLNHPDWFGGGRELRSEYEGRLDRRLVEPAGEGEDGGDVDRLAVAEALRRAHGLKGTVADFRVEGAECALTYKGPGYSADVVIERETGKYTVAETAHGVVAILNDLHKGRDTGPVWSILIDVSAVAMTFISVTGLALIFWLKLRRRPGLATALVGVLIAVLVLVFGVP